VVYSDPFAIGRDAAELLFERLDGYRGPSRHRSVATRLVPRGSGEIPPPPDTAAARRAGLSGAQRAVERGVSAPPKAASKVG
jgi:hypothetical protein